MRIKDIFLALLVVGVWGANFTVIAIGLAEVPPLLLASVRYVVVALPAIFFVRRPNVSLGHLIAYGLTVGVGQFGALFYAMAIGMPAGLSSVVLQSQAFLTMLFAVWLLRERITWRQLAGVAVAALGLVLIAISRSQAGGATVPLTALMLTIGAAASWSLSNIVVRRAIGAAAMRGQSVDMLGLVIWGALVSPVPLFGLAWWLHGSAAIVQPVMAVKPAAIWSVAYIAYGATIFGFVTWNRLLAKYPASTVAPFSLLVPVTGLLTAGLVLAERLTMLQWVGSVCIAVGLLGTIVSRRARVVTNLQQ